MKKVLILVGPTASGKTDISIKIAKKFNLEIINGDSVQIYKDLNIATAKITEEEKQNVKHYLLDEIPLKQEFTVYDYQKLVRNKIKEIDKPFIVGGTGFYIKSVLCNYEFDKEIKKDYNLDKYTNLELYNKIKEIDSLALDKIHINNRNRLIRCLESIYNTNKLFSSKNKKDEYIYNPLIILLNPDREILYERINKRVDIMIKNGLIEEAYNFKDYNLNIIGYKELNKYFNNEITKEEAIEEIKKNTRHYAKRQITYFKNQLITKEINLNYNDINKSLNEIFELVNNFYGE